MIFGIGFRRFLLCPQEINNETNWSAIFLNISKLMRKMKRRRETQKFIKPENVFCLLTKKDFHNFATVPVFCEGISPTELLDWLPSPLLLFTQHIIFKIIITSFKVVSFLVGFRCVCTGNGSIYNQIAGSPIEKSAKFCHTRQCGGGGIFTKWGDFSQSHSMKLLIFFLVP